MILAAEEHILGLENRKKRYIDEVTALSQAFAFAIPHGQTLDVKDEVAFFQAVKARLAKFDSTGTGRTSGEIESTIRQVIDKRWCRNRSSTYSTRPASRSPTSSFSPRSCCTS